MWTSEDYNAHDILLCINTGEKQSTEKYVDGDEDDMNRGPSLRLLQRPVLFQEHG